ncbi:MAG: DUF1566 domain-containing protein [Magnetococcus sp. DMHC-6]
MKIWITTSILAATFFLSIGLVFAEDATIPHTFTSGTKIISLEVNENFNTLLKEINLLKQEVAILKGETIADPPCTEPDSYGFCDNGNGTVTHEATGLVFLKNANCFGSLTWDAAMSATATLANGACGLTDGSKAGEWRLPTYLALPKELELLLTAKQDPVFSNVQANFYWSSTTVNNSTDAWIVNLYSGGMRLDVKTFSYYIWPVRNGH